MSIFRINKNKNYVTMSNHHFKEKEMSLKAKGLLSQMLSLPDDWNYSIEGLTSINKENETSIKSALNELQKFGYLKITKLLPNQTISGRIEYVYDVYEEKQEGEKQGVEILGVEFLGVENQGQYNNINNKIINNKINKIYIKFEKPTLEEVEAYCKERNNNVNAKQFYDYYEANEWKDRDGKKVKSWKQKVITWEGRTKKQIQPNWLDKDFTEQKASIEEQQEMEDLLKEFK